MKFVERKCLIVIRILLRLPFVQRGRRFDHTRSSKRFLRQAEALWELARLSRPTRPHDYAEFATGAEVGTNVMPEHFRWNDSTCSELT